MTYAIERQWFVVLTGACGSGKSTFNPPAQRHWTPFRYRCLILRTPS